MNERMNVYNKQLLVGDHLLLRHVRPNGIFYEYVCCYNRCLGNGVKEILGPME
jgi:hypothetical protein